MPFMVIYRTSDGSSCYEQADAIDEAALLVERLRNKEGLDQIRIYRMEEISFAFRPYYKVELGLTDRQSVPAPPSASTAVAIDGPAPPSPTLEPASHDDGRSRRTVALSRHRRWPRPAPPPRAGRGGRDGRRERSPRPVRPLTGPRHAGGHPRAWSSERGQGQRGEPHGGGGGDAEADDEDHEADPRAEAQPPRTTVLVGQRRSSPPRHHPPAARLEPGPAADHAGADATAGSHRARGPRPRRTSSRRRPRRRRRWILFVVARGPARVRGHRCGAGARAVRRAATRDRSAR